MGLSQLLSKRVWAVLFLVFCSFYMYFFYFHSRLTRFAIAHCVGICFQLAGFLLVTVLTSNMPGYFQYLLRTICPCKVFPTLFHIVASFGVNRYIVVTSILRKLMGTAYSFLILFFFVYCNLLNNCALF